MIFLGADLSNAENRVGLVLTRDPELVKLANIPPWERDPHAENAAMVFGVPVKDVTKEQRQLGKAFSHGAMRGMRGDKLSDTLLKQNGIIIPPDECQHYLDMFLAKYPQLEDYFREIKQQVVKHRALSNSWGRTIYFDHDNFDEDLFREALSWPMQSEVADLVNIWGVVPLYWFLANRRCNCRLVHQGHDSLLVAACNDVCAYETAVSIRYALERSRCYYGSMLTIPLEFSLGATWDMDISFRQFPPEEYFCRAARQCMDVSTETHYREICE